MAKKVTANGKTFTFDDNITNDQIGTVIDEYFSSAEKKNRIQNVAPTGTQTSNRGSLPFLPQVSTKIPSVLLSDAQKQQREQERIGKRFETTLLNIPTEFGRVAPAMKAAKQIQETLPEAPSFRKYGEIPRMQPTAMTEGQRLGESLTEGTDFQELTTDKFTEKKTGLQKQIENAENAFRAYQGDEIANQVQSYIPPEETLKIKEELGFTESVSRTGRNFVNRLQQFIPNTALALGGTLETILGEDIGGDFYAQITKGGDIDAQRREAFARLDELKPAMEYTKGFIESGKDFDIAGLAAAVVDATSSLLSTVITSAPTAGIGLYSDMVGGGVYDYNTTKANRLGLTVEQLYETGQNEFIVPAMLQGFAAKLENIGLKGIKQGILANVKKGSGQRFALIAHNSNREGYTEFLQTGVDAAQNALAEGKNVLQAGEIAVSTMFSKKGAESYLMGVVASGAAIGGGRILKGLFSDKSKKKASQAIQAIEQQQQELSNPDLTEESRVFVWENIKNNVAELVDAVDSDVNETDGLSEDQKREVNNLNTKIQAFEVVINDPAASEETKNRAAKVLKETQAKIDDIINKKPPIVPPATGGAMVEAEPIAKPAFDTEEQITEEAQQAEAKFAQDKDQVTYEQKMKELDDRANNLVPAPEVEVTQPTQEAPKVEGSGVGKEVGKGENARGGTWEEVITEKDGLKTTKFKGTRIKKNGESIEVETGVAGREMTWDDFLSEFKPSDIDLENITDRGTPESVTVKELREGVDGRNAMTVIVDWGKSERGVNERITQEIKFDRITPKPKEDAVSQSISSKVPVLTEATVGEEVEQGKPQPKTEVVTEEGAKAEEVGSGGEGDVEILNTGYFGNGKDTSRDYRESNEGLSSNYGTTDLNSVRMYKDEKGNDVSEFFSLPKYKGYRIKVKEKSGKKLVSIHFESFNVGSDRSGGHGAILFEVPSTTNIDSKLIDKFIPVIEKYKTDNYSIQDGKLRPFKEFDDFTKPDFNLAKQKTAEQTPAQQVKQLRAEEQAELNAAIPNADQYKTDGKVDRAKITDAKDLKKFDKIYDKYDKLITPLLPKKEAKAEKITRTLAEIEKDQRQVLAKYHDALKEAGIYESAMKNKANPAQVEKIKNRFKDESDRLKAEKESVSPKSEPKLTKNEEAQKEVDTAVEDLLDFVRKSRGTATSFANVGDFSAKMAKVFIAYAKLGIVKLEDVIAKLRKDTGDDFVNENIDEIEDAWREANDRGKKTSSDFKNDAEKLLAQEEKERLRQEDLGLVTPKLEDYESKEPTSTSKDFESLAYQAIESDEFRYTLSNKERESGKTLTRAEKRYQVNPLMAAFELGESIVAKAKEEFGDTYVNDLLAYIAKNQNTLGVDKSSLILLTLENDLNRQQLSDPNNITLAKQERMVQNLAIAYQRSAARAVGYGRLRQIARVGYDVDEVTNQLFSSEQVEGRRKVVKAMESTADEINNEAELQEQETEGELIIEEPKVKRDAKQVRADIKEVIKQMRADLVKSARGAGGALSAIPFAQQVKDVTPHIIKLSKLFAELGGMKTKEIVAEIRKSIKGLAPDVDEAVITDILKGEKTTPKKAPKDRLEQAKDRVNKRIEELKQEIEDKRKELKVVNKVKSDAELDSLLEQEKELKKIANQYLTQESIDRINESKEKSIVTKLENEIANIDEQIANQQKLPKSSSSPVTSLEITLLKAQRKARIDVLNELDPNPKAFTKQALIDAGYSREITVTRKGGIKEKIQVLDWKKLAGNEMDVNAIKNIVEQALKDKGFTPAQISRMQDAFVNEFTELRASVVEKSIKELRKLNEPKESTNRKSSAKRLAELFDLGLFDQNSDEFDYLINKAIGLSDIGQEAFFEAKKLSESLKELFAMNSNEFFTKQFIREINLKISKLLNKVAFHEGNNWYRVTNVVSELMNLALRTLLQTLKQFFDNQISGRQERLIQDIGTMFQKGIDTKELKKLRLKYSSVIKSDITKNAGLYFGEVNSPFLTKSQIEGYINSRTDNQIYHALVSIALGKSYLEGADSMNKAASTEKFFTSMLLKAMTDKTNPNRMTPEAALQFVNEQLTGQKFADALIESAKIINQINTQAGKVVLANTKENIFRGAMDLVKANLLVGQALDANTIESAYDAAYKIAGYGLGHESNNFVTTLVNGFQSRIEEQIKKAVKEKEWGKAANLTVIATINRNILNPFVGGGTNWFVLGLQKSGIEPISPLYYMMQKMRNGIDLSTDSGKKKLEETLVEDYRRKTINKRLLIGGVSASLLTLGLFASGGDDEMEEWLKKNEWARGYQTVFVPQLTLFAMSVKNGKLGDWVENTFARYKKFENLPKIIRGVNAYNKSDGGEADKEKLYGVIGNVAGSFVNVPLLPVKFARDLGGVYRYIVDKPQEKSDFKNVGFANGFFNYGLIDYMGFRPDRTYMKNMEEYIPESDEKTIKFLRKNDLDINSNSDKAVLSNGIKKSLTEDEAQKYDNIWGKEAYRVIKEALVDNDDMDETQIKSLKKVAEFTATRKAQSELDVDNSSLQELEMDGVKYSLTEAQINKRKALIKEYIRDNRNSEKFKDRYREAIKKGNIIGSAESKYFMLMESAKSSATRKMNDIYENKTSALEVIPK